MKKNMFIIAALLSVMLVFAACGNSSDSKAENGDTDSFKVGFAIKTQDSPYFVSLVDAMKEYAKEEGWKLTVLDANGDTAKETENIETFIAQGMDLIYVDAIEPDSVVSSINKAAEAGIGVINLDSGVSDEAESITTIYSDNLQNGRLVGLAYAEKMSDEEVVSIILSGAKGNVAGEERRTGLFAGILEGKLGVSEDEAWKLAADLEKQLTNEGKASNKEAKFSIVGQGWGAWTEQEGLKAAEDLITANPNLTTVLGENDQMLFGAMTALKNAGNDNVDIVAAADGAKEAYDLIKEGLYFATGENSPYKVAQLGIQIGKEILVDGKESKDYDKITLTKPAAVTKDNVDEYYEFGF
ncbi:substrate-binding domain-containing protein [Sporosarcina psychrophila]|uniref:substrate-binding domain-containing protein n=1 Tax=Sporosarcina psychrophila TaxID=1476 RepID=UPI00078CAEE7|nr:substrate-binding domain-containing protein [Sporosarcina psychrophila]AMQ07872.1 LacI family transcriptional regulator [Sporosarcina psychrophila]